jgi:maleate isomerase
MGNYIEMAPTEIRELIRSVGTATVYQMLKNLGIKPIVPNAGSLLAKEKSFIS